MLERLVDLGKRVLEVDYPLHVDDSVGELDLNDGQYVEVGVRPEDVRHVIDSTTDEERVQRAPVDVVEPMGSDNFRYVDMGQKTWTSRVDPAYEPDPGNTFTFTFDIEKVHLFAEDGTTIKSQSHSDAPPALSE